jgi:hypothetical protein
MLRLMTLATAVALLGSLARAEEEGKPRPQSLTGLLAKLEAAALTVTLKGDGGERSESFAVDANTKIMIQTDQDEQVPGEGGNVRMRPKTVAGKLGDLKAQQRVTVSHLDKKALEVLVLRVPKARENGEK